jgi:hypothetical protein
LIFSFAVPSITTVAIGFHPKENKRKNMSDREGHSGLPPVDDDLSLPKATVAKMITGSFVVSRPPPAALKNKKSANLTSRCPCLRVPTRNNMRILTRCTHAF